MPVYFPAFAGTKLINHVAEQERLREEREQARKQDIAKMKRKRILWVKLWLQRKGSCVTMT